MGCGLEGGMEGRKEERNEGGGEGGREPAHARPGGREARGGPRPQEVGVSRRASTGVKEPGRLPLLWPHSALAALASGPS